MGLGDCEGLLHAANRKRGIGLLLDLSEPFKLADREKLLEACLQARIVREDFINTIGRQRIHFYYPTASTIDKLEEIGFAADRLMVNYGGQDLHLTSAYEQYIISFKDKVKESDVERFQPFVYGLESDKTWLQEKLSMLFI